MSQVLYRKYRSQDFSQIFGQESVKKVLTEAIKEQKAAHAYLFTGPRGTGKTSMARILAKSLNCTNRKGADPCNKCSNCLAINESRFMDLIEIDAASNRGIDEIRDLKEKVGFLPVEGAFKVYIIDEVHMLTSEAFNALLKTLEEPPGNVVFILATTEAHKLPLTIISRTQRFDFRPASNEQLKAKLKYILGEENISYEDDAIDMVISAAGGSFRDAESVLEKIISSTGYKKDLTINSEDVSAILGLADSQYVDLLMDYIYQGDAGNAFKIVQQAGESGVDFIQYSKQLLFKARRELIQSISGEGSKYNPRFLFVFIKEVLDSSEKLRSSLINTLPLEMATLSIIEVFREKNVGNSENKATPSLPTKSDSKKEEKKQKLKKVEKQQKVEKIEETQKVEEGQVKKTSPDMNFDGVSALWVHLISDAKKANPHLAALLIKVVLKDYKDERLLVEVPFKFHQKQLENGRVNSAFQELAKKVYGGTLVLEITVNESLASNTVIEEEEEVSNISVIEEVFGDLV